MTSQGSSPEMALISDSIESANARVRFFRIAYGNAETGQEVKANEIKSVLKAMYHGSRTQVTWEAEDTPRVDAKLALLSVQCLETAMPYGGQVRITRSDAQTRLVAEAERLVLDEQLWSQLSAQGPDATLRPAQVQFGLLADMVRHLPRRLSVVLQDNRIEMTF